MRTGAGEATAAKRWARRLSVPARRMSLDLVSARAQKGGLTAPEETAQEAEPTAVGKL